MSNTERDKREVIIDNNNNKSNRPDGGTVLKHGPHSAAMTSACRGQMWSVQDVWYPLTDASVLLGTSGQFIIKLYFTNKYK